jgi:hypothetical protein
MPELRRADKELSVPVYRRKIYRRTDNLEKYLIAPFDYVCGRLPAPAAPLDYEMRTVGDVDLGDDAETDGHAIVWTDAASDDAPHGGDAVVSEGNL